MLPTTGDIADVVVDPGAPLDLNPVAADFAKQHQRNTVANGEVMKDFFYRSHQAPLAVGLSGQR